MTSRNYFLLSGGGLGGRSKAGIQGGGLNHTVQTQRIIFSDSKLIFYIEISILKNEYRFFANLYSNTYSTIFYCFDVCDRLVSSPGNCWCLFWLIWKEHNTKCNTIGTLMKKKNYPSLVRFTNTPDYKGMFLFPSHPSRTESSIFYFK